MQKEAEFQQAGPQAHGPQSMSAHLPTPTNTFLFSQTTHLASRTNPPDLSVPNSAFRELPELAGNGARGCCHLRILLIRRHIDEARRLVEMM